MNLKQRSFKEYLMNLQTKNWWWSWWWWLL